MVVVVMLALVGVPNAVAASDGDEPIASTPSVGTGLVFGPSTHEAFDELAADGVVVFNDFEDVPSGLHRKLVLQGPDGSVSIGLRTTKFRWPPPPRGAPARAPVAMLPYDFVKEPAVHRLMGVVKTKGPKGKFVPDGQSRFELVLDPPVSHVGFMRPWNTWSVTRFYDAAGGLLAKHRNTVDHQFVGYVAATPEDQVRRVVLDGVPSQPDDEYNKLYMAGTIEDLYLSGGRPEADDAGAAQAPDGGSAGDHPDDMVIDAPGGALDGLSDADPGEGAEDDATAKDPDREDASAEVPKPDAADTANGVGNELVEIVKAFVNDGKISREQLRLLLKVNMEQDDNAEAAFRAMILYELLFSDDDAESPTGDASADEPQVEAPASEVDPPAESEADPPEADAPVLLPADPLIGVTDVGSPIGYDALDGLAEGTGGSSDTSSEATAAAQPRDPPPPMQSKHVKAGRTWVSLDTAHEVRKIVPKRDPKTKKQTGWKAKGKVTLQTGTWYQMKDRSKDLVFYDTTGKPVGVAGRDEKRGLQYEQWTGKAGESP